MAKLIITGNPGVGKHTIAKFISEKYKRTTLLDINRIAIENDAILRNSNDEYGIEVDVKKLIKLMTQELKSQKDVIIVGHLAPYVLKPNGFDLVVVLRRSPYELIKIFTARKYSPEKSRENVASEILGITLYDAVKTFGKDIVAEFDTTGKSVQYVTNKILSSVKKTKRKVGSIDWLSLLYENGDIQKFLE